MKYFLSPFVEKKNLSDSEGELRTISYTMRLVSTMLVRSAQRESVRATRLFGYCEERAGRTGIAIQMCVTFTGVTKAKSTRGKVFTRIVEREKWPREHFCVSFSCRYRVRRTGQMLTNASALLYSVPRQRWESTGAVC